MQIFSVNDEYGLSRLSQSASLVKNGCILALGFFDGVHLAHRALINEAKREAERLNLPLAVFTFSQNDASFKSEQLRLFTEEEKLSELSSLGVDAAFVFSFELIKNVSADDFIKSVLIEKLNTHTAFCGFNFKFGKNAEANAAALKAKMEYYERGAVILPEHKTAGTTLSSSLIRSLITEKKLSEAAKLLGKPFFLDGKVSHGLGVGKKMGIPTLNVSTDSKKLCVPRGVYFSAVEIHEKTYFGVTNVGVCPTFDEREAHAETFVFDFDENLYDSDVRIYFIEFIRDEIRFSTKEELIMQINIDIKEALKLKEEIKWQEIGLNLQ